MKANKGSGGFDGIQVDELLPYLINNGEELRKQLRNGKYKPNPVRMDLQAYFDTVNHGKLIEVLSRTIKEGRVISLIHKYLHAGVMEDGVFRKTEESVPQGGSLSPLLGNITLNEMDKELEQRGHKFVRYANDCMILCKSRKSEKRTMEHISPFITEENAGRDVHPKSVQKMKNRLRVLTTSGNKWSNKERKQKLRNYVRG